MGRCFGEERISTDSSTPGTPRWWKPPSEHCAASVGTRSSKPPIRSTASAGRSTCLAACTRTELRRRGSQDRHSSDRGDAPQARREGATRPRPIAFDRFGWRPLAVGRILVLPDTDRARRLIAAHEDILASAFPARGPRVRRWLRKPSGNLSGIVFVADTTMRGTNARSVGVHRVRVRRQSPEMADPGASTRSVDVGAANRGAAEPGLARRPPGLMSATNPVFAGTDDATGDAYSSSAAAAASAAPAHAARLLALRPVQLLLDLLLGEAALEQGLPRRRGSCPGCRRCRRSCSWGVRPRSSRTGATMPRRDRCGRSSPHSPDRPGATRSGRR